MKKTRDYKIFDEMSYKYNTKVFSYNEKHPISQKRF